MCKCAKLPHPEANKQCIKISSIDLYTLYKCFKMPFSYAKKNLQKFNNLFWQIHIRRNITIWACFQKFWGENVLNFTIHVCAILQNYLILRQISTFFFNLDASSGIIKMDTIKFEKFHQKDTQVGLWWPCIFTDVLLQKTNHHQNQGIGREATRINLKECICLIVLIYENVKPLIFCRFVVRYVHGV